MLPSPGPERVRCIKLEPTRTYPVRYGWALIRHLSRRRTLRLDATDACVETEFVIPAGRYQRWLDAFGGTDVMTRSLLSAGPSPLFSYHSAADTSSLFALARRIGIPFKNILHASTAVRRRGVLALGRPYTAVTSYQGAEPRRSCAALLRFRTEVRDGLGDLVLDAENTLFVGGLPQNDWERLARPATPTVVRRKARRVLEPEWSEGERVSPGMGRAYGSLSGDLNPLHISSRLARLLGHPTGFIQGMCAYNLTVGAFRKRGRKPLTELTMKFSRPFYIGSALTLNVADGQFEWVDSRGKVVAYGGYRTEPIALQTMRNAPATRRTHSTRPGFALRPLSTGCSSTGSLTTRPIPVG